MLFVKLLSFCVILAMIVLANKKGEENAKDKRIDKDTLCCFGCTHCNGCDVHIYGMWSKRDDNQN